MRLFSPSFGPSAQGRDLAEQAARSPMAPSQRRQRSAAAGAGALPRRAGLDAHLRTSLEEVDTAPHSWAPLGVVPGCRRNRQPPVQTRRRQARQRSTRRGASGRTRLACAGRCRRQQVPHGFSWTSLGMGRCRPGRNTALPGGSHGGQTRASPPPSGSPVRPARHGHGEEARVTVCDSRETASARTACSRCSCS